MVLQNIKTVSYVDVYEQIRGRVLLFGAGVEGKEFYDTFSAYPNIIQILGFIDSDINKKRYCGLPVFRLADIKNIEYEHILVTSIYIDKIAFLLYNEGIVDFFHVIKDINSKIEFKVRALSESSKSTILFYFPNHIFLYHFGKIIKKLQDDGYIVSILTPSRDVLNLMANSTPYLFVGNLSLIDKPYFKFIDLVVLCHCVEASKTRPMLILPHYNGAIVTDKMIDVNYAPLKNIDNNRFYLGATTIYEKRMLQQYIDCNRLSNCKVVELGYIKLDDIKSKKELKLKKVKDVVIAPTIFNEKIKTVNLFLIKYSIIKLIKELLRLKITVTYKPHKATDTSFVKFICNAIRCDKKFKLNYEASLLNADLLITDYSSIGLTTIFRKESYVLFYFHYRAYHGFTKCVSSEYIKCAKKVGVINKNAKKVAADIKTIIRKKNLLKRNVNNYVQSNFFNLYKTEKAIIDFINRNISKEKQC